MVTMEEDGEVSDETNESTILLGTLVYSVSMRPRWGWGR